jgi:hypothetical protein
MADNLIVTAGLGPVAARLPGTAQENQIINNAGLTAAVLSQTQDFVLSATGNDMALPVGIPFPPGSRLELIKNGTSLYVRSVTLGGTVTSPAVAGSTVAVTNSTGGDVAVTLGGTGVVTKIQVGSVAVLNGTNLTGSVVAVPKGSTITLTYGSGTPTWVWNSGQAASLRVSAGVQAT